MIHKRLLLAWLSPTVQTVARTDATVIVQGGPGAGKSVVARAIHDHGPRARASFLVLDCSAMTPESLLEDLGPGPAMPRVAAAAGGTLVLDHVDHTPKWAQSRLREFLKTRQIRPDSGATVRRVDLRVIALSNCDLEPLVASELFRADLYYQLDVLHLVMPSLEDQRTEIPSLAEHFVSTECLGQGRLRAPTISAAALTQLVQYSWPGNLRELNSAMSYSLAMANGDSIEVADLPPEIRAASPSPSAPPAVPIVDLDQAVAELEARLIDQALTVANGSRTAAARLLRIKRTTLVAKLERRGAPSGKQV